MTGLPKGCRYSAKRSSQGCVDSTSDSAPHRLEMPGDGRAVSEPVEAAGMLESRVVC